MSNEIFTKISKKKMTRRELEKKLTEMSDQINDIKVLAVNLESRKRKELEKNVSELQKVINMLKNKVTSLENNYISEVNRTNNLVKTVKSLTSANNAASTVINCMESWFDSNHEGWDEGARDAAEKRADLLKERASIASIVHKNEETDIEKLNVLAERMLEISNELGTDVIDLPMIMSIYLKARNIDKAEALIAKVRDCKLKLPKDTEFLIGKLEDEINKKRSYKEKGKIMKMPPVNERRIITPR